jgi:hypothetical protein
MRMSWCFGVLLAGCSSHGVRCDAHLQPINQPARASAALTVPGSARVPTETVRSERSFP